MRWRGGSRLEPGVTVVVPACNVARYLGACLDSVLAQTWWRRCRVLVVDDGSTDDTGKIADAYAARHPQISVVHQPNRGPGAGAARNVGLDRTATEFVLFLDGDDELTPTAVELLVGGLERERLDLAVGATEQFPSPRSWLWTPYFEPGTCSVRRVEQVPLLVHDARTCNKLYRTAWLRSTGLRFAEGIHHQDTVVNVPAMLRARRFVLVGDVVHRYRKRAEGGSVMDSHFTRLANYFDHLQVIETLSGMIPRLSPRRRPLMQAFIVRSFQGFARRAPGMLPAEDLPGFFGRARAVVAGIPPAVIEEATADADQRMGYVAMLEDDLRGYRELDSIGLTANRKALYRGLATSSREREELLRTGATRAWLDDLNSTELGIRARLRLRIVGARHLDRSLTGIVLRGVYQEQTSFEAAVVVAPDDDEGRAHTGWGDLPVLGLEPGEHLLRSGFLTPTGKVERWVRLPSDTTDPSQAPVGELTVRLEDRSDRAVLVITASQPRAKA